MKAHTATNKFLRRLKLTSRELPGSHIEKIITEYACDLRRGATNLSGPKKPS